MLVRPKPDLLLSALAVLLAGTVSFAQTIIYVDADAAGANNGTSWPDAFTDLQAALAASISGDQIWVAAGTYKPAGPGGPRTASFNLRDGVGVYGGFAVGETNLAQRDIPANPTILSGDLIGDDGPDFANNGENSYHVTVANNAGPTTILDGLTITAGNADNSESDHQLGGGLYITGGSPIFVNCHLTNNAAGTGGAILTSGSISMRACTFSHNKATSWGGALNSNFASPLLVDCLFDDNTGVVGGAITMYAGMPSLWNCRFYRNSAYQGPAIDNQTSMKLVNCVFAGNSGILGGAISNNGVLSVFNSTFAANAAERSLRTMPWDFGARILPTFEVLSSQSQRRLPSDGAPYDINRSQLPIFGLLTSGQAEPSGGAIWVSPGSTATVSNSVLWSNLPNQITDAGNGASVSYSCIQGGWPTGPGNVIQDPLFVNPNGEDGIAGTPDDDLRLAFGSSSIDAGRNSLVPVDVADLDSDGNTAERTPLDADRMPRFLDDPATRPDPGVGAPPVVDMGAYEYFADCNTNGIHDSLDISFGTSADCTANGAPDECEPDCNANGIPDSCDVGFGTSQDCNSDEIPDECPSPEGDCNSNGIPDLCDIAAGMSLDCNGNASPDECEPAALDCNENGTPDACDIAFGTAQDCDSNGTPDVCDAGGPDCNANGTPDWCDLASGLSEDCNENAAPDECDVAVSDCNRNGLPDGCDIVAGTSEDCNSNAIPDECDVALYDCNSNGVPDDCDLTAPADDCQRNGVPDECEVAAGTSADSNANGIPDECECIELPEIQDPEPALNAVAVPVAVVLSANEAVLTRADGSGDSGAVIPSEFECGFRPWRETLAEFRATVERGEIPDPAWAPLPVPAPARAGASPRVGPLGTGDLYLYEDSNHVGWSTSLMVDAANDLVAAHGDNWDFVAFWLNFPPGSQFGSAFYMPLYNDVSGTGDGFFNLRSQYGVAGNRIQGFIMMYNVANWDHGTSEVSNYTRLVLGQEFEHRFGVFLDPVLGTISLQGWDPCGRSAHWNWKLDGQGSGMEMREWTGIWPAQLAGRCVNFAPDECFNTDTGGVFSLADLYLMGYVSGAEMDAGLSQFRFMNDSDCAAPYFGNITPISSGDIIAANGPRVPNSLDAPHHFKAAWVMIYQPEAPPTPEQIDRALGIMTQQQNDWYFGTLGRGTLDNSIVPSNCTTEYDFFLATENPPALLACDNAPLPICRPGQLEPGTTYYWQVVAANAAGTVSGPVWSFATETRDCNVNGVFDPCELSCGEPGGPCDVVGCGPAQDCNENGIPDPCDVVARDCNSNGAPDDCDIAFGASLDCGPNGTPDECDIASGTEGDCDANSVPDSCEGGCNDNGIPDSCDIAAGTSLDCNFNGRPDECDVLQGFSGDCTANGVPDECESDCNSNSIADSCDLAFYSHWDCDADGLPDLCNITAGGLSDCNADGVPDECDADVCVLLWSGFEPVPPFSLGVPINALDYNGDGSAWDNPSGTATIGSQGCPASTGKALKIVSQTPPTSDYLVSERFAAPTGPISSLSFDARSEAALNPRIDWQLSIRDAANAQAVILIHWASTQSNYPGVTAVNGRGRILVLNPAGSPAFINSGFAIPANSCYSLRVSLDTFTGQVQLFINGTLRVSTTRLAGAADRMSVFRVEQKANGQAAGGINRLALDNFNYCAAGAAPTPAGMPDCNTNSILDECDVAGGTSLDCNADGRPDACERAEDFNGDGEITAADYLAFSGCTTVPCGGSSCEPALYADPCCGRADFEADGDVDLVNFARLQRVLPASLQDFDMDGDVDLDDFAALAACMAGPGVPVSPACAPADIDADSDADLADFASFQRAFTGP